MIVKVKKHKTETMQGSFYCKKIKIIILKSNYVNSFHFIRFNLEFYFYLKNIFLRLFSSPQWLEGGGRVKTALFMSKGRICIDWGDEWTSDIVRWRKGAHSQGTCWGNCKLPSAVWKRPRRGRRFRRLDSCLIAIVLFLIIRIYKFSLCCTD